MQAQELYIQAKQAGVVLYLDDDGNLSFKAAKGSLTAELRETIQAQRVSLTEFLEKIIKEARSATIYPTPRSGRLEPSAAQRRMLLVSKIAPSYLYNMPFAFRLSGELDIERLIAAFTEVVQRHEVLRTRYQEDAEGFYVEVDPPALPNIVHITSSEARILNLVEAERHYVFDLSQEHPLRIHIISLGDDNYVIIINLYHIAGDGWSLSILLKELVAFYDALAANTQVSLPVLPIQYVDYATWHNAQQFDDDSTYWRQQLANMPELHSLPTDYVRSETASYHGGLVESIIPAEVLHALKNIATETRCTLFTVLQTAFAVLLGRWSRESDIVVGTPVAGRSQAELNNLIGFFINSLVLRTDIDDSRSFLTQLSLNRHMIIDAFEHQSMPFERLVELLNPKRSSRHHPLFQILFTLQNNEQSTIDLPEVQVEELPLKHDIAKFDIFLSVQEKKDGDGLLVWEYATDLFAASSIQRLGRSYLSLLSQIVSDPSVAVGRLPIWDDYSEQARYSYQGGLSAIASVHPDIDRGVWDLFSEVSERCASQLAYQDGQSQVSYQELRERSLRKALELQRQGVCVGDRVGIGLSRSGLFVEWMLATVALGGVYVPLDPSYPADRLQLLLGDSSPKVVVCDERWSVASGLRELRAEVEGEEGVGSVSLGDVSGEGFLYMMYTSGTTGVPKGVEVTHRGVIRLVRSPNYVSLGKETVMGYGSNVSFDASTFELWGSLLNGGKLVLIDQGTLLDGAALQAQLLRDKITTMFMTTALLEQIATVSVGSLASLDTLLFGGEAYNIAALRKLWTGGKPGRLVHVYGPTENTTFSTSCEVEQRHIDEGVVPIGRPIAQSGVWVLDEHQRPLAPGALGELVVTGLGLARGYWGRAELTQEKFIELFNGERGYRTGDLVRWSTGGELLFEGRLDDQVKLRGFRVELGEVASVLQGQAGVSQAVVVMDDRLGDRHLVGYVVMEGEVEPGFGVELQDRLRGELPSYMVPSIIECVAALPLTANGKVDKAKLPLPRFLNNNIYVQPRNSLEGQLQILFSEVLKCNVEDVSINADFFALGGHSLLAAKLVTRINQMIGWNISIAKLFEYPTIELLAGNFLQVSPLDVIALNVWKDNLPLSYNQEQLVFLHRLRGGNAYNMPFAWDIRGSLDVARLKKAFYEVVLQQPILRTYVRETDDGLSQALHSVESFPFKVVQLSVTALEDKTKSCCEIEFDLSGEWPMRVWLLIVNKDNARLVINIHHSVCDGASMNIILETLSAAYQNDTKGTARGINYFDFAKWQREQKYEDQLGFWKEELADLPDALSISSTHNKPNYQARHLSVTTNQEVAQRLAKVSAAFNTTEFLLFQSVFASFLSKWLSSNDICTATVTSGRNHPQVHNVVGAFVNTLVLRTKVDHQQSLGELVNQSHQRFQAVLHNQDVPFGVVLDHIQLPDDWAREALTKIMVTFGEENIVEFRLEGCELTEKEVALKDVKFELSLHGVKQPDGLQLNWIYDAGCFSIDHIEQLSECFNHWLDQVLRYPEAKLQNHTLFSENVLKDQLARWRGDNRNSKPFVSLLDDFQNNVRSFAERRALVTETDSMTYAQLDLLSNTVANALIQRGIHAGDIVAVALPRGIDFFVAVIGIMKLGAAYLPIDLFYPLARQEYILTNSKAKLLVSSQSFSFSATQCEFSELLAHSNHDSLSHLPAASDLAYVIYTSGSTGRPKGVPISYGNVFSLMSFQRSFFDKVDSVRVLQFASTSFDASVLEWMTAVTFGGTLMIASEQTRRDPATLTRFIQEYKVNFSILPPSLLPFLNPEDMPSLRWLISGGEALSLSEARRWSNKTNFFNAYGPSEGTVYITIRQMRSDLDYVSIGHPIQYTQCYLINDACEPVPIGQIGEMAFAGDGLTKGYLHNSALTSEKFVSCPFDNRRTIYRTGDLMRWAPEHGFEYISRKDEQVKIRGHRVELREITQCVETIANVKQGHVTVCEVQGSKRIACYFIAKHFDPHELVKELIATCQKYLPAYMQPSYWVPVDAFPLTVSNKIDKKLLPSPIENCISFSEPVEEGASISNPLLQAIETALGHSVSNNHQSFFEIGGDSIQAMKVVNLLRVQGIELAIKDLYQARTLTELLSKMVPTPERLPVPTVDAATQVPLSGLQQWILEDDTIDSNHFNQSILLELESSISFDQIEKVVDVILQEFDGLGIKLANPESHYFVYEKPNISTILNKVLLDESTAFTSLEEVCQHNQKLISIDDNRWSVFSFIEHQTSGVKRQWLHIVCHHFIVDAVSWQVLLGRLQQAVAAHPESYYNIAKSTESRYFWWLSYRSSDEFLKQIEPDKVYWSTVLKQAKQGCFLGEQGNSTVSCKFSETESIKGVVSTEVYQLAIEKLKRRFDLDEFGANVLLFACACQQWHPDSTFPLLLEKHGRKEWPLDMSHTVGWLTSAFPFVVPRTSTSVIDNCFDIKQVLQAIPMDGLSYDRLAQISEEVSHFSKVACPWISFNHLGKVFSTQDKNTPFRLSAEAKAGDVSGNSRLWFLLAFTSFSTEEGFCWNIDYDPKRIKKEDVLQLEICINTTVDKIVTEDLSEKQPADFPTVDITRAQLKELLKFNPTLTDIYPATLLQSGMLYHSFEDSKAYINQIDIIYDNNTDPERLHDAWLKTIRHYAGLKTAFAMTNYAGVLQVVTEISHLSWKFIDAGGWTKQEIDEYNKADLRAGLDIERAPLMRFSLLTLADGCYQLVWTHHHALLDGWSLPIILDKVRSYYSNPESIHVTTAGEETVIPSLLKLYQPDKVSVQLWQEKFSLEPKPAWITRQLKPSSSDQVWERSVHLSPSQSKSVYQFISKLGITANIFFQGALAYSLSVYARLDTFAIGTIVSGRNYPIPGITEFVGMLIQTMPLVFQLDKKKSLRAFFRELQHEFVQLESTSHCAQASVDSQRWADLFHILYVYENYPTEQLSDKSELGVIHVGGRESTNYPLSLSVADDECFYLKWCVREGALSLDELIQFEQCLLCVIEGMLLQPEASLAEINLYSPSMIEQEFHTIASVHPDIDRGVWDLFSEVSERCASQLAYQDGQSQVSYQELRERSLRKALELQRQGVCVGDRVGIGLSRSGLFVEWMLATVALGGVYVPLDPSYPADRLQLLLGDSSPKVVVCDERWSVASGLRELRAEVEGEEGVGSVSLGDVSGEGFLYMMYTSGTTGVPKGVEVTHRGVIRLVRSPNYVSLGKETVMGYGSNVSFDASTFELWGSLLNGGKLVLIDQGTLLDGAALQAQLLRDKINTMVLTPALLTQLVDTCPSVVSSLDTLLFGGDVCSLSTLEKIFKHGKPRCLVNGYGPTENTTFSTSCEVEQRHIDEGVVPIGRPIAQSGVWVLDEHQRPLAPGALGELVVTGLGLARGYWGRAELTQEKFIELFNGERGYRTGDLVRWSTGGELLFEGRLDDQVKLRGFRVELGEVASVLQGQAGVSQAVVVMDDRLGDRHLVGYVVMEGEVEPGFGVELQDRLRGELPSYMVPSIIECVAALPLTANGKVDKAKLPLPRFLDTQQYEPPFTETESIILKVLQGILNDKQIGVTHNFFEVGGHSLLATKLVSALREQLSIPLLLSEFIENPTVRGFAEVVSNYHHIRVAKKAQTTDDSGEESKEILL